ncbi:hypothetical protein C1141_16990, partial [Vibrio agarivorans]
MNLKYPRCAPKTSAAYQCVREEKPIEPVEKAFQEQEEEPMFAYGVTFACHVDLFKSAVMTQIEKMLGKSQQEDRITQWNVSAAGQYTQCVAQVKKEEKKKFSIGWRNQSTTDFGIEDITPQEKDKLTITETFMPIRPAIQTGKVLGLPTEGYIYHFLEGKLVHEYRFSDKSNNRFHITRSIDGAMNTELLSEYSFDFILAISEKGGQTVTDQYLLYSREPLDDDAMQSIDKAFLNENGILLDMSKLTPLVGGPGSRKHHQIEQGDTLIKIADKSGLSLEEIYELNPYWKGKERKLEVGQKVYLEELAKDFNHSLDVFYPTSGDYVAPWLFVIRKAVSAMAFPVVTIARSADTGFGAIAPIRYAIDVCDPETLKNEVIEGVNKIEDKTIFTGGIFRSDKVPYTLRQLRDGWLYLLSQDPETEEWSVSEYEVTKSELYRYVGNTVEERANATAEKPVSYLLYPTDRPCYIGFSIQRWTQRIQDIYVTDEEVRTTILRDPNAEEHRASIHDIENYVADVGKEKDLSIFNWTSASVEVDDEDKEEGEPGLISSLMQKIHEDYQYLVPTTSEHHFVALDDPIADITDLHLRLSQSILPILLNEEAQRKVVIAETVRSMVRISIPKKILNKIDSSKWISVEQDIDTCLEHHYSQYVLSKYSSTAQNYYSAKAAEAETFRKAYPAALSRLTENGIDEALLKARLPEYIKRRKAHSQVNWKDLDVFYQEYLSTRSKCVSSIERDLPILIDALQILGPKPTHFGLDDHKAGVQIVLSRLVSSILDQMTMGIQCLDKLEPADKDNVEAIHKKIESLVDDPKSNIVGISTYFFSEETFVELERMFDTLALPEVLNNNRVPIAGFLSAFNDVVGFNGESSGVFKATKNLIMPMEERINNLEQWAIKRGDKGLNEIRSLRFKTINILLKLGSKQAARSTSIALWGQIALDKGTVTLNKNIINEQKAANSNYHHLLSEAKEQRAFLHATEPGSQAHEMAKKNLQSIDEAIGYHVNKSTTVFQEYMSDSHSEPVSFKKLNTAFDAIGRMDFVVASLNIINLINTGTDLKDALNSAPFKDTKEEEMTVAYSAAWFINNVGATVRAVSLNNIESDKKLMRLKFSDIESGTSAKMVTAKQLIKQSLIASVAGVIAAGLEGFQVIGEIK